MLSVPDCVADRVWFAVPNATEWQRVGDPVGDKDRGRTWTHCFAQVMEELSEPLLRQSNNGAHEHRAA